jgi:long-chain acyl-CoA synthetase
MNLAHLLARAARTDPARLAIFSGATPVASYGEWQDRAARLAGAFHEAGLAPGERVVLFQRNHPRYLEVLLGAWWAGLVVVPVNAKLHPGEAQWIIDNAQARWAFVTSDVAPSQFEALERQVDIETPAYEQLLAAGPVSMVHRAPDDIAWLFYTSGTTGRPKGVMLTHRNLMTMGLTYFVDVDPVASQDAIVYAAPMSHGAGIYAIPHLMAGARHIVPASGGVEPAELFGLAKAAGPLSMFAAPTIVKRLVDHAEAHGESSEGFKTIVYGGAPTSSARCGSWDRASSRSTGRERRRWWAPRWRARTWPTRCTHATPRALPRLAWRRRRFRCAWPTAPATTCRSARWARCWCAATR